MVFNEAAYREVFPEPVFKPALTKIQEAKEDNKMLPDDDQEDLEDDDLEAPDQESEQEDITDDTGTGNSDS